MIVALSSSDKDLLKYFSRKVRIGYGGSHLSLNQQLGRIPPVPVPQTHPEGKGHPLPLPHPLASTSDDGI